MGFWGVLVPVEDGLFPFLKEKDPICGVFVVDKVILAEIIIGVFGVLEKVINPEDELYKPKMSILSVGKKEIDGVEFVNVNELVIEAETV